MPGNLIGKYAGSVPLTSSGLSKIDANMQTSSRRQAAQSVNQPSKSPNPNVNIHTPDVYLIGEFGVGQGMSGHTGKIWLEEGGIEKGKLNNYFEDRIIAIVFEEPKQTLPLENAILLSKTEEFSYSIVQMDKSAFSSWRNKLFSENRTEKLFNKLLDMQRINIEVNQRQRLLRFISKQTFSYSMLYNDIEEVIKEFSQRLRKLVGQVDYEIFIRYFKDPELKEIEGIELSAYVAITDLDRISKIWMNLNFEMEDYGSDKVRYIFNVYPKE